MQNVTPIMPCNNFKNVAENAAKEITCGLIIGYDSDGRMQVYGGGLIDGKQPVAKDWLWLTETFNRKLLNGDYAD